MNWPTDHRWDETFIWYDGPVLFTTVDGEGQAFIGLTVTDDLTWLVPVTGPQLAAFKAGTESMQDFIAAGAQSFTTDETRPEGTVRRVETVPDDWYPGLAAEDFPLTDFFGVTP